MMTYYCLSATFETAYFTDPANSFGSFFLQISPLRLSHPFQGRFKVLVLKSAKLGSKKLGGLQNKTKKTPLKCFYMFPLFPS
jgi:hypothetical protein